MIWKSDRRPTGISATVRNCSPMSRGVASSSSRRRSKAAWKDGVPNPFSAFERLGRAYLEFARTEPAYYSAMFEGNIPLEVSQELRNAGESAFAVIRSAAERLVAQIPPAQRPPAFMVALHVWSLAHGIASRFGRGDAGRRRLPMQPEELLEAGVLVYLRGLGFPDSATISR